MATRVVTLEDGDTRVALPIDDRFDVLDGGLWVDAPISGNDLGFALSAPIESPSLEDIVVPGEHALVVVPADPDPFGAARLAALLVLRLRGLGISERAITILVGRGPSAALDDAAARAVLGDAIPAGIRVVGHDPWDEDAVEELGETSWGTPVEVNRLLLEFDHVLATGSIGFHPLEGFTGGRAAFVPACASARSGEANRALAIDELTGFRRAGVGPGRLDGNAVHEDMEEAARFLEITFVVNATRGLDGELARAYAGDWRHAHRRGAAEYAASHGVRVSARRPLVVVSAGPLGDGGIGSVHAAVEHAAGVTEDGGTIVVLGGTPPLGHVAGLDVEDDPTLQLLGGLARRFELVLASPGLAPLASALGAEQVDSLPDALDALDGLEGYVIPSAVTTLPYVAPAPESEEWADE